MATKIFFDTNIIIDILDKNRSRFELSKSVLKHAIEKDMEIVISSDMLTSFFYICQKSFDCHTMAKSLVFMKENFTIFDFSKEVINSAILQYKSACEGGKAVDFEDLLQLSCAEANGCTFFITEDKEIKNLKTAINVLSCDEFLRS